MPSAAAAGAVRRDRVTPRGVRLDRAVRDAATASPVQGTGARGSAASARPLPGRIPRRGADLHAAGRSRPVSRRLVPAPIRSCQAKPPVVELPKWRFIRPIRDTQVAAFAHLYNSSAEELLTQVRKQDEDVAQLLLVAHAPGVPDLTSALVTEHTDLMLKCAPATLAEIVFDVDRWSSVEAGRGTLRLLLPSNAAPR